MLDILWSILFFFLTLGILITFHELGHFWVARYFNVYVYRFSIGFGKILFKTTDRLGTEYTLCMLPFGGYVKMADELVEPVPEKLKPYSFRTKPLYARSLIVFAGPFFNFLLSILALWLMFMVGITSLKPGISTVLPNSIAQQAGLQPDDQIIAINRKPVYQWQEIITILLSHLGDEKPLVLSVLTNQHEVKDYQLNLKNWQIDLNSGKLFESLGFVPQQPKIPPIIGHVSYNGPAAQAGIKKGDKILAVNQTSITSWQDLIHFYDTLPQHKIQQTQLEFRILRGSEEKTISVNPEFERQNGKMVPRIGIESKVFKIPEQYLHTQKFGIFTSIMNAISQTMALIILTFTLIAKLVFGKLSLATLSGPIGIAQGAGMMASQGLSHYLNFIATLSISLGVLNLLPIPLLDGGHLLFFFIEFIKGKPVPVEVQMRFIKVGLFILLFLMFMGMVNDLKRILF